MEWEIKLLKGIGTLKINYNSKTTENTENKKNWVVYGNWTENKCFTGKEQKN